MPVYFREAVRERGPRAHHRARHRPRAGGGRQAADLHRHRGGPPTPRARRAIQGRDDRAARHVRVRAGDRRLGRAAAGAVRRAGAGRARRQDDDFAIIDIRATLGGEEVEQLTRTDYLHRIGSGEFGPRAGRRAARHEARRHHRVRPDVRRRAYPARGTRRRRRALPRAGEGGEGQRLPPLDDDLAKTASEFDTLDELRTDLREKIPELKERESVGILRDRVLDALVDARPGRTAGIADRPRDRAPRRRGPARAERTGSRCSRSWRSRDGTRSGSARTPATTRCAPSSRPGPGGHRPRREHLEVTPMNRAPRSASLAQAYNREPKELAKQLDRSGQIVTLAGDIIRTKALDLLVERADITDEAPTTAGEGEQTAEADDPSPSDRRRAHDRSCKNYLVPVRGRADQPRRALVRHLLAAAEGAHRVPRHADRRQRRQPHHGAAAAPGVRGPRQGHQPVHQLAGRGHHGPVRHVRHDAVHQAATSRRS